MFNDIIQKKKEKTRAEESQEKINKIWNLEKFKDAKKEGEKKN